MRTPEISIKENGPYAVEGIALSADDWSQGATREELYPVSPRRLLIARYLDDVFPPSNLMADIFDGSGCAVNTPVPPMIRRGTPLGVSGPVPLRGRSVGVGALL